VEDGAGKAALSGAHDAAETGIVGGKVGDDGVDAVAAVVVHYNDLIRQTTAIQRSAHALEERTDVVRFAKGGNDKRERGPQRRRVVRLRLARRLDQWFQMGCRHAGEIDGILD
jgi:hypothetical protein